MPGFCKGMRVELLGLSAGHYNGQCGTIQDKNLSNGRWTVLLDSAKQLAVRTENLRATASQTPAYNQRVSLSHSHTHSLSFSLSLSLF